MTLELKKHDVNTIDSEEKKNLLMNTICKGATKEEFELFLHACRRTGLDPFMRQIYAVKRKEKTAQGGWRDAITIQTGIDGYRLIAERTGRYAPGKETIYQYDTSGNLISASSYVKKRTDDGTWHEVSATAFYDEYVQTTKDRETGVETPTKFWHKMRHTMLAKCAESLALRKAFPAELSGIYTAEEMKQADAEVIDPVIPDDFNITISQIMINFEKEERDVVIKVIEMYKEQFQKNKPDGWKEVFNQFLNKALINKDRFRELVLSHNTTIGELNGPQPEKMA